MASHTVGGGENDRGFQEEEIARRVVRYGDVAHVLSTYQKHYWGAHGSWTAGSTRSSWCSATAVGGSSALPGTRSPARGRSPMSSSLAGSGTVPGPLWQLRASSPLALLCMARPIRRGVPSYRGKALRLGEFTSLVIGETYEHPMRDVLDSGNRLDYM